MGQAILKEVPKLKEWCHFSGEGEYDHMEFIKGIDMNKEYFELPARFVTEIFKNLFTKLVHRWYRKLKQAHGYQSWNWWKPKLLMNGPMIVGDLRWEKPLNNLNSILTKRKIYHGFADRRTD
ncbi:hypothetical protein O181_027102 [Austropuccinia psidii MF-1]|uniref:Uncharacterized protein n=1 Tax=Austropuccinia psidii MF-1 TaxID=1389203 RepID=A0A9Q3CPC5_9BASI|nr:hypothetical protein [Austropuccinia psidii MF-1]